MTESQSSLLKIIESNSLPVSKRTRNGCTSILKDFKEQKDIYISATEFENFCDNDLISDWFNVISSKYNIEIPDHSESLKFLFKKGIEHEDNIINKLRELTGLSLEKHTSVSTSREYDKVGKLLEKKDIEKLEQSIKLGEPIIYSAFICDRKEKIRGIPDLLIRNDYIDKVFPNLDIKEELKCEHTKHTTYYIPVEIKFSSVHLSSGNKYVLNQGRMKKYKTQLFAYCKILQEIQGVFPPLCFIIGKRTVLNNNKTIKDSIECPGVINYFTYDNEYSRIFSEGLKWLKEVKMSGFTWSMDDLRQKQLYPNMKSSNLLFYKDKKELSDQYGEITELWRLSTFHRNNALEQGIYSWKDERFNSEIARIAKPYRKSLDNILKVNREGLDYYPESFESKEFREVGNEMFVDFEILRDSFDTESYGDLEYIFLIGVRYKGEYKGFSMNSLSSEEERRVIDEFYNYVLENGSPTCWYWCAEVNFWNKAMERHNTNLKINWKDLYEIYTKESFVVKGSFNFKLKSYIKSLVKIGKIDVNLPPESCSDGISAMTIAWNYYCKDYKDDKDDSLYKDVIYYNSLDCQYVDELLKFARNNL